MGYSVTWSVFENGEALAEGLAGHVAEVLETAVARRGVALLAVSGGTTPARFFRALSAAMIPWPKVIVTLVDERLVDESSPRSNAGLVRANLLQRSAAAATFVPLFTHGQTAEAVAEAADLVLRNQPWPLDVAVLGMGADGHTASFFPDARGLDTLLDPSSGRLVLPVHAESAGEPRLTLSLPALANAGLPVVHIEGKAKRKVLEEVISGADAPIGRVLAAARQTPAIYWAP
ncbi:MAG: 6-phosphogluconolactonase [Rhizobiaceae bacterium]|nr:6-phosphogluconolactonase [Rhizobiaceae bacterium]